MKKAVSIILCVCLIAITIPLSVFAEETDSLVYLTDRCPYYDYVGEDVMFAGQYEVVKEEYDVWLFIDEQGEEMVLVTETGLNKESIEFNYRRTKRIGLPNNAKTIDWHFFTPGKVPEGKLNPLSSPVNYVREEMKRHANSATAYLTHPHYILGGCEDFNGDGIYQELEVDFTGATTEAHQLVPSMYTLCDTNKDTEINLKDVLTIRKILAHCKVPKFVPLAADLDNDGDVSLKDVLLLRKFLVKIITMDDLRVEERSTKAAEIIWNLS